MNDRIKLINMGTEEKPDQWYFDCDSLYIDVEHENGEVSIFVKVQSNGSVGWKELIEKPKQTDEEEFIVSVVMVKEIQDGFNIQNKLYEISAVSKAEASGKALALCSEDFPQYILRTMVTMSRGQNNEYA